jgi:putative endonuclease
VFYVYVLRSQSDAGFYIGFSTDLKRRLSEHTRGASFATKSRGPWKLIYYEVYTEREDAEGREKFLKSGAGRRFLRTQIAIIYNDSPLAPAAPIMPRRSNNQPHNAKPFTPLASSHVSERFYVVHLVDGTYELVRHFYRVKGFASRGLVGLS